MKKNESVHLMGQRQQKPHDLRMGQVIVIIAAASVALVAILGLSIDGGRLILLHREQQNVSDAATLASTLALCSGGTESQIIAAGESAAAANGYVHGRTKPPSSSIPTPIRPSPTSRLELVPNARCWSQSTA